MQHIDEGCIPSYSLKKYNNQFNDLSTHGKRKSEGRRFQLDEVISKLEDVENDYASSVTRYRSSGDKTILKLLASLEAFKKDLNKQRDILCERLLYDKNISSEEKSKENSRISFNQSEHHDINLTQREFLQIPESDQCSETFEVEDKMFRNEVCVIDTSHRQHHASDYYLEELKDRRNRFSKPKQIINKTNGEVDSSEKLTNKYKESTSQENFKDDEHWQEIVNDYYEGLKDKYNNFKNLEQSTKLTNKRVNTIGNDSKQLEDDAHWKEIVNGYYTKLKDKYKNIGDQKQVFSLSNMQGDTGDSCVKEFKDVDNYFSNQEPVSHLALKQKEVEQSDREEFVNTYNNHEQEQFCNKVNYQESVSAHWEEELNDGYNIMSNKEVNDMTFRQEETDKHYNKEYVRDMNFFQSGFHRDLNMCHDQTEYRERPYKEYYQNPPRIIHARDTFEDVWSVDVYNHVSKRTLDYKKFVHPVSLLGGYATEYRQYNFTYFNNQPSEEVKVFEYGIESPYLEKTSAEHNDDTSSKVNTYATPTFPIKFVPTNPISNVTRTSTTVHINDIISRSVDTRHVIILRGLPGSGKSRFCQSFKEKEVANGHSAPRILSIDPYFMEDGVYEYDASMEPTYLGELFKIFKRQIDEGFFNVILVDSINDKVEQFSHFYHYSKMKRFQPLILCLNVPPTICAKRSEKKFNTEKIYQMAYHWEETPSDFMKLDATSFLQDSTIEDVEMEDATEDIIVLDSSSDEDEILESGFFKSKWDEDFEETKERLDGKRHLGNEENAFNINDFLKMEEDEIFNSKALTKKGEENCDVKRVKWADYEELKRQKKRKELGFVAGYTDWSKIMGDDIVVAEAALVQVRNYVKDL